MRIVAPDGRAIEFVVAGPDDGFPLVIHHHTPGAALAFEPMVRTAAGLGFTTVMVSRPGYGGSTARPGRVVADVADDVSVVLDALGAGEFVTVGFSGGGPHALACAALLPQRCRGVASVAGFAPFRAPGLDFVKGMGAGNVSGFALAVLAAATPDPVATLTGQFDQVVPSVRDVSAATVTGALSGILSDVDKAVLNGEFAAFVAASMRLSVSTDGAGWRDDNLAFLSDWGFALDALRVPVSIWQGGQDLAVPFDHGRWLAEHIPGARAQLRPGDGHLTIWLEQFDRILAEL